MREALYNMTELLHSHYDIPYGTIGASCPRCRLNRSPSISYLSSADLFITDCKYVRASNTRELTVIHRDEVSHRFRAVGFIRDVDGVSNLCRLRSRLDLKLKHDYESATWQGPDASHHCFRPSDT